MLCSRWAARAWTPAPPGACLPSRWRWQLLCDRPGTVRGIPAQSQRRPAGQPLYGLFRSGAAPKAASSPRPSHAAVLCRLPLPVAVPPPPHQSFPLHSARLGPMRPCQCHAPSRSLIILSLLASSTHLLRPVPPSQVPNACCSAIRWWFLGWALRRPAQHAVLPILGPVRPLLFSEKPTGCWSLNCHVGIS